MSSQPLRGHQYYCRWDELMNECMIDWFIDWLIDWLINWLISCYTQQHISSLLFLLLLHLLLVLLLLLLLFINRLLMQHYYWLYTYHPFHPYSIYHMIIKTIELSSVIHIHTYIYNKYVYAMLLYPISLSMHDNGIVDDILPLVGWLDIYRPSAYIEQNYT